jgi:phosphatidylserine/phosphatidylglycerophosphate/cardiolipin synthase-like enzyme
MSNPIQDPLNVSPPFQLANRPFYVTSNALSLLGVKDTTSRVDTMRLMYDPFDTLVDETHPAKWFDQSIPISSGNEAMFLIRGTETFGEMVADIRAAERMVSAGGERPFVYLLAWYFDPGGATPPFTMIPGDPDSQPHKVFERAAKKGVEVRVMLWSQRHFRINDSEATAQANFFNSLPGARCIVDDKTAILVTVVGNPSPSGFPLPVGVDQVIQRKGTHHQKVLIVNGPSGLSAYCGGLDIASDRVDSDSGGSATTPPGGLQDVHVKIRGPAAFDLLRLFRQRWDDYLYGSDADIGHDENKPRATYPGEDLRPRDFLSGVRTPKPPPVDHAPHRQFIQIGRTSHSGLYTRITPPDGVLDPAHPTGEKSIRKMIFKGIDTADRFIYIEDQYLFDPGVSARLLTAIAKPNFRQLVILIPGDDGIQEELHFQAGLRRAQFLNPLLSGPNGKKVHVFTHNRYTHAKIYIFDDRYAIIGSANCNRRGLSHDSEVDAGIFDRSSDQEEAFHFAHRLRMRLWATHLNLHENPVDPNVPVNSDDEFSELADGVASVVHWLKQVPNARVHPYVVDTNGQQEAMNGLPGIAKFDAEMAKTGHAARALSPVHTLAVKSALRLVALQKLASIDLFWNDILDPSDG